MEITHYSIIKKSLILIISTTYLSISANNANQNVVTTVSPETTTNFITYESTTSVKSDFLAINVTTTLEKFHSLITSMVPYLLVAFLFFIVVLICIAVNTNGSSSRNRRNHYVR